MARYKAGRRTQTWKVPYKIEITGHYKVVTDSKDEALRIANRKTIKDAYNEHESENYRILNTLVPLNDFDNFTQEEDENLSA